jgi:hypothetical protein
MTRYATSRGATKEFGWRRRGGFSDEQIKELLGEQIERCNPVDPEERQIEGYINNAPEMWRTDEELRVEEAKIFRPPNAGKQRRKARLVLSM